MSKTPSAAEAGKQDANVLVGAEKGPIDIKDDQQYTFSVEVDSECKAKKFQPWKVFQSPHHISFHLVWLCYMACQLSTFSAAALGPVIKDDINATQEEMNGAGIAALAGSLLGRLAIGWLCDKLGPRTAMPTLLMLLAPVVCGFSVIWNVQGLIAVRFLIGVSLGAFVVTQYISSAMFNVQIVGFTNGSAGGWGLLGSSFAQLFMPLIYQGISSTVPGFTAWRWAFFVPGGLMMLIPFCFYVFAKDCPKGNFRELIANGQMHSTKDQAVAKYAYFNYRTYCIALGYAFGFGVELTVNNVIVSYINGQFNKDLITAGGVGSIFGFMNIWSRSTGGFASDSVAKVFGMRGRLWLVFCLQLLEGAFCIGLGFAYDDFAGSVVCLCFFAIFAQVTQGATYALVPFVSKRALGGVSGIVGAGGSAGGIICMSAFFYNTSLMTTYEGFQYMGYLICGVACLAWPFLHFPMWGSMFRGPTEGVTEVSYYMSEYTEEEIQKGMGTASMKFAQESKSQRGSFRRGASKNKAASELALASSPSKGAVAGKTVSDDRNSDSGSGSDGVPQLPQPPVVAK